MSVGQSKVNSKKKKKKKKKNEKFGSSKNLGKTCGRVCEEREKGGWRVKAFILKLFFTGPI